MRNYDDDDDDNYTIDLVGCVKMLALTDTDLTSLIPR